MLAIYIPLYYMAKNRSNTHIIPILLQIENPDGNARHWRLFAHDVMKTPGNLALRCILIFDKILCQRVEERAAIGFACCLHRIHVAISIILHTAHMSTGGRSTNARRYHFI